MLLVPRPLRGLTNIGEHNFLIHGIIVEFLEEMASHYAKGELVDLGCGSKPYGRLFQPYVLRHIGVDLKPAPDAADIVDILGSAYDTTLADQSCDTVLCTELLEHLEQPLLALQEVRRILRPGGHVILTVPFIWHVHEAPRDFYRYSEFGLRHLFDAAGLEVLELKPLTGFVVTFTQLGIYFMRLALPGAGAALRLPFWALQQLGLRLNRHDRSRGFTSIYGVVGRKRS